MQELASHGQGAPGEGRSATRDVVSGLLSSERGQAALAPWEATGLAALRQVGHRRAATIFRSALDGGELDLNDRAIERAIDATRAGEPLAHALRQDLEARLAADFRHVRIHTDETAAHAAAALHAEAFTLGDDIFFAAGAFAPSSEAGQRLLVHELTHVIQAQQGRTQAGAGQRLSDPSGSLEQEAHAAYDRTAAQPAAIAGNAPANSPAPIATAAPASPADSQLLLRAPRTASKKAYPSATLAWLKWDSELIKGFLAGIKKGGGKGLDAKALQKLKTDFTTLKSLMEIHAGFKRGAGEGLYDALKDNLAGLGQIAEWLFWNATPAGQIKELLEEREHPGTIAARRKEAAQRSKDFEEGMSALVQHIRTDPDFFIEIGGALGEAAGEYFVRTGNNFANASPEDKGRMVGHAVGYLAFEIATLFLGPEVLVAKAPAAAAKIARLGGKVAQKLLRVLEKIPQLKKLLQKAGWLDETVKAAAQSSKLLKKLSKPAREKIVTAQLNSAQLKRVEKLDPKAVEHLLKEIDAKDLVKLEKQLGKAELEKLSKTKGGKDIKALARKTEKASLERAQQANQKKKAFKELTPEAREKMAETFKRRETMIKERDQLEALRKKQKKLSKEDTKKLSDLKHSINEQSWHLGEVAAHDIMTAKGGKLLYPTGAKHSTKGDFDLIYKVGDEVYIVEAKGGTHTTALGTRKVNGKTVQQGTKAYMEDIIDAMTSSNPAAMKEVVAAQGKKKLKYCMVRAPIGQSAGKATLSDIQISEFVIK